MKKSKLLSLLLLLTFIATPLFGSPIKVEAQLSQPVAIDLPQQAQSNIPNDELGTSSSTGQMRTTTMAKRIAAALHLNLQRSGSAATYAGINPDTSQYSPLAKVGGVLAKMVEALLPPDYFGVANWANSALPQLDGTGAVIPGTGIRKFIDTLPGFCGQPGATNSLGQCIPVGIPDTTTFANSDYYEIALVEYREQMSPDLPAPGTKIRGYVQVTDCANPGAVPLTTANGLTQDIVDRNNNPVCGVYKPHYLGPMILAQGCSLQVAAPGCTPRAVRVKFDNYLPTGPAGDLFIPTDTTYMGAGMGPGGSIYTIDVSAGGTGYTSAPSVSFTSGTGTGAAATATVINGSVTAVKVTMGGSGYATPPTVVFSGGGGTGATATANLAGLPGDMYTQNRATLHLHGGDTPWISDGTPHQWTTPFGELTSYSKGDSVAYVPDMWFDANGVMNPACAGALSCPGYSNDPGLGSLTFYWTNQQSGRLLFYHDHAYGITRLNVYAGEAAGYLIVDPSEEATLLANNVPGTIPDIYNLAGADLAHLVPLVIQDKSFVPDNGAPGGQLALTDPTWDTALYGGAGDLWFPHVYIPNQNPADIQGANAFGRWDYGPWFWPPQDPSGFVGKPYECTSAAYPPGSPPAFPPLMCPGVPNPSGTPEGFMDTPVVNGALYPTLTVDPTAYRFQILSVGNDRSWNFQLYKADPLAVAVTAGGANYTLPPIVGFTGGGGSGAAAVAHMSNGTVTSILLTNPGHGYTVTPNVTITGNGTGAAATAVIDPITTELLAVRINNGGAGYTSATVTIDPPVGCTSGCVTATATAIVTPPGSVIGITVTNPGAGYTSNPTVTFTNAPGDITGAGAAAIASINSEVKMVPAVPHDGNSPLPLCTQENPTSGARLVTALMDANGNPLNGTGLQAGCWPVQWPTDGRDGGVPDPLTVGPPIIQIGTESGLLPSPVVIPSTPVNYNYNRRDITVLNVDTHGMLLGPAERAEILIDFSQYAGQTLLLYNDSPAPIPAFDSRIDYYTGDPDQTMAGGAPTTLPGYGPNTRTIMQIKVNAAAGGNGSTLGSVTVTNVGAGYTAPIVSITGGGGSGATAVATGSVDSVTLTNAGNGYVNPVVSFQGGGGSGASAVFTSGTLSGLTLTAQGGNYVSMPTISFTGGGGSLAAASAFGTVDAVTLSAGGGGYANTGVSLAGGGGSGATASATGGVDAVAVTGGGAGYAVMPNVSFSGGGGTGTTATATGSVDAITLSTPGAGYTTPSVTLSGNATASASGSVDNLLITAPGVGYVTPVVDITGGGGSGATASATTDVNGAIIALTILTPGSGYTSAPTVTITDSGGPGAGATANATISVTAITVTAPGSGYAAAPLVTISDTGVPVTAAAATATLMVNAVTVTAPGSGYTVAPAVVFDSGAATATSTLSITTLVLGSGGSGYASAPTVSFTGGGTGAAATATLMVSSLVITSPGSGYTSAPTVVFTGGGGSGAAATATISTTGIQLLNGGNGYSTAPLVVITDNGGNGSGAAAVATINVNSITLTAPGSGYTSIPAVAISDTSPGAGFGATAVANLAAAAPLNMTLVNTGVVSVFNTNQNQIIIPEDTFQPGGNGYAATPTYLPIQATSLTGWITGQIGGLTLTNPGSGYSSAPTVSFTGGGGSGAVASLTFAGANVNSLTLTAGGTGYTAAPSVVITGGGGNGATATATITGIINSVTVTRGGSGYTTPPAVSFQGGGGTGATAVATISGGVVTAVTITNGGTGYTGTPNVRFTGGGGSGARATATITGVVNSLLLTNGGTGYSSAPTVSFTGGGGTGAAATATYLPGYVASLVLTNPGTGYTSAPTIGFVGGGAPTTPASAVATAPVIGLKPKAIQELFTLDYGRMNATFGVELPLTNFFIQTTIPYGYIDPPTELIQDGQIQLWKFTHNGVDTHFIHFHLYDVQVINRVGWDGMIKPPDSNEVGWKDTVRMNPLEDIIVALRPMKQTLPFEVPNSMRPMDVTQPIGASNPNNTEGFANIDPSNQPAPVTNDMLNFGWEYVIHCHILGHEENDMMRAESMAVTPDSVSNVSAVLQGGGNNQSVLVTWTDGSSNETGFTVQRATTPSGPWLDIPASPPAPGRGTVLSFTDTTIARRTTYYYQVVANNVVGYTQTYAPPAIGYPSLSADSVPVAAPAPITTQDIHEPGPIFADSFETGLNMWSGIIGDSNVITAAVIGPNGGMLGMVTNIGQDGQPAYVYDNSPEGEVMYDGNFYFNPNGAQTTDPVDVFLGIDQDGQPTFGVQYKYVDANTFALRAWVMHNDGPEFTSWDVIAAEPNEDEPVLLTHKIDVAWASSLNGGISFYVDDVLFHTLSGDTSSVKLQEVLLGPSLGLHAGDSGSMYFDEFTSSRLPGLSYSSLMPVVSR